MKKLLAVFALAALQALAQSATNPLVSSANRLYAITKNDVLKSAEEMPEESYSFKPVDTVRTFGQLVGHVADSQYEFCAPVVGDGKQIPGIEKSKTSKTELIQALKDGFAYCDSAFANLTDAHAADMVKFFNRDSPKLTLLSFNTGHNFEHYGNMITYLRLKGMVPPSSQGK